MQRVPVQSTNVKAIGYDAVSKTLQIEFLSGGVYEYAGVPDKVYGEIMKAPSIGSYFHQKIRDKYPTRKVS